jgi:phenylpropionate dioxygenase-like ring-hydroxylating dioxygenase large terminal subunit
VRTETGEVFALEDRCAHRQIPLSSGVVFGDKLQCCYHAWRYDQTGKICGIPYLPKGSKIPPGVRSYPCREGYGHIFVFPGNSDKAKTVAFPKIPGWSSSKYQTMNFSKQIDCHYSFMHENLMDMNHQFLHRRLMGNIKATLLNSEKGEDWVQGQYKFEFVGGKQHKGAGFLSGPKEKDPNKRHFDVMDIRTQYPYQTLQLRRPNSEEPSIDLWVAYVPVDKAQRKHHSFGMLMVRKPKIPGLVYLLWPIMRYFTESVFKEDRWAVQAEQRAHDLQGEDWNQEIFPLIHDLRAMMIHQGIVLDFESASIVEKKSA